MLRLIIDSVFYVVDRLVSLLLFVLPFYCIGMWLMGEMTGRFVLIILGAEIVYVIFCSIRGHKRAWAHSREAMEGRRPEE